MTIGFVVWGAEVDMVFGVEIISKELKVGRMDELLTEINGRLS